MKGFKRQRKKKEKPIFMFGQEMERGHVYMVNFRHDDWCKYWQRSNPDDCNCNVVIEPVKVTAENEEQVAANAVDDEKLAKQLREIAQRRN